MVKCALFIGLPLFFLLQTNLLAQDSLKIMHYNLLHHANYNEYCTSENNNVSNKEKWLKTIFHYVKPDVFTVNELSSFAYGNEMGEILEKSINVNGVNYYDYAQTYNQSGSKIMNGFFYNTRKLYFHSRHNIAHNIRDIDFMKFYLNTSALKTGDTTFIHFIVTHYKAGDDKKDKNKRLNDTQQIMNYLDVNNIDSNIILCGDLNIQDANESSYLEYTSSKYQLKLKDPLNFNDKWHNNATYSFLHTQSTALNGGCKAGGGMDDRFDFILVSDDLLKKNAKMYYMKGSYKTIGQDAKHFNKSLDNPENNAAPDSVINALKNNSDHLPVSMKTAIPELQLSNANAQYSLTPQLEINNPVSEVLIVKNKGLQFKGNEDFMIRNYLGTKISKYKIKNHLMSKNKVKIPVENLKSGLYFLFYRNNSNKYEALRFIKY